MNPIDQLELDVLTATGDLNAAETAGLLAAAVWEGALPVGLYVVLGVTDVDLSTE